MPSGQDYANRLREDAHRSLAPHVNELEQELNNLRKDMTLSLGQLGQKLESIRYFGIPEADTIITEALEEAARERDIQFSSVAGFAHRIRQKETQEEILSSLLEEAGKVATRAALFVVRDGQFLGWSSRGFSPETAEEIRARAFDLTSSTLFQKTLDSEVLTTSADLTEEPSLHFIQEEGAGPWHVFPLKAIGRPVALLLAAGAKGCACHLESLCLLMDLTGLRIENLALKILKEDQNLAQQVAAQAPALPAAEERPVELQPELTPAAEAALEQQAAASELGEEDIIRGRTGGPQPSPPVEPVSEPPHEGEPEARGDESPDVSAEAERARQGLQAAEGTPEAASAPQPLEAAVEAHALAEEEKLHSDAKRFARLLVSEIKLYNEQRVLDGRQNRDLYVRLKKDIDKSREMYEKRVPPSVAGKIDYFHDEIVRILGENDPSTLGSDYPGPRVES